MEDGTASRTARSVAAHRLEYDRVAADDGDPAADQALTADVAGGQEPTPGCMHEYLRARTAFFDHTARRPSTAARGRSRSAVPATTAAPCATPGSAWPGSSSPPATQADKVQRVARLGLERGDVRFIAADFTADPIAEPWPAACLDPARLHPVPPRGRRRLPGTPGRRACCRRLPRGRGRRQRAGDERVHRHRDAGAARPLPAAGGRAGEPAGRSSPTTRPATSSRRRAGSPRRRPSASWRPA